MLWVYDNYKYFYSRVYNIVYNKVYSAGIDFSYRRHILTSKVYPRAASVNHYTANYTNNCTTIVVFVLLADQINVVLLGMK